MPAPAWREDRGLPQTAAAPGRATSCGFIGPQAVFESAAGPGLAPRRVRSEPPPCCPERVPRQRPTPPKVTSCSAAFIPATWPCDGVVLPSDGEQRLDGAALVHRLVRLGGLIQ